MDLEEDSRVVSSVPRGIMLYHQCLEAIISVTRWKGRGVIQQEAGYNCITRTGRIRQGDKFDSTFVLDICCWGQVHELISKLTVHELKPNVSFQSQLLLYLIWEFTHRCRYSRQKSQSLRVIFSKEDFELDWSRHFPTWFEREEAEGKYSDKIIQALILSNPEPKVLQTSQYQASLTTVSVCVCTRVWSH